MVDETLAPPWVWLAAAAFAAAAAASDLGAGAAGLEAGAAGFGAGGACGLGSALGAAGAGASAVSSRAAHGRNEAAVNFNGGGDRENEYAGSDIGCSTGL